MLVLSLFPGIGLLDQAFEEEGFCVVRGPDLLWGGDIRGFCPPHDTFDGIIGGPPCQSWSGLGNTNRARWGDDCMMPDRIPEFARCVNEAQPEWFLMENVPQAPAPDCPGYVITQRVCDNRWVGGEQSRRRKFTFGCRNQHSAFHIEGVALEAHNRVPVVLSSGQAGNGGSRRSIADMGEGAGSRPLSLRPFPIHDDRTSACDSQRGSLASRTRCRSRSESLACRAKGGSMSNAYRTGYLDGRVRCGWAPRGGPWVAYALGYAIGRSKESWEGW